jgi:hypothetical protein
MGFFEAVLRIRIRDPRSEIRDPVLFYPLDPGSGSGMNFLRIPDLGSRIPDPRGMFFGEIFLRILVLYLFY